MQLMQRISVHSVMFQRLPNNTVYATNLDIYFLGVSYFHVFPDVSSLPRDCVQMPNSPVTTVVKLCLDCLTRRKPQKLLPVLYRSNLWSLCS